MLDKFDEKYFEYFISTYEKNTSWYRIVSFEDVINHYEQNNFEGFDNKNIDNLNNYISDVKKFIKSNSYQAAFEFLGLLNEISTLEKQLTAIKIKKGQDQ